MTLLKHCPTTSWLKVLGGRMTHHTPRSHPLVVIIGATGCGKTKLSLELGLRYRGEIISADSMQVYKGLDIATNKATPMERSQIPHHLLDVIDPFQQFTVLDFQRLTLETIDQIESRDNLPIIVGGTNYYIESILWDTLVGANQPPLGEDEFRIVDNSEPEVPHDIKTVQELLQHRITYRALRSVPDDTLHRFLTEIDPESARNLHVNNRRKIIRCIQVYQQTGGARMSRILEDQRSQGSRHGGPLRFEDAIIFWLDCDQNGKKTNSLAQTNCSQIVLNQRLDDRVDEMISQGLIEELLQFHRDYNDGRLKAGQKADYTEGIFQAIGLKEFHQYLLMSPEERDSYQGQLKLGQGILMLKQRTRSYVTKQLKWIRRRFLVQSQIRRVPNIYRLDTTDPKLWDIEVYQKASKIFDDFIVAIKNPDPEERQRLFSQVLDPISVHGTLEKSTTEDESFISGQFYCDICHVQISGGNSYRKHLTSKRHRFHLANRIKSESTPY